MNVDDLEVKRGDPVLPAWRRLLEWVRGLKVMTGPGVRLNVTPQGVVAVLEREVPPWQHPWKTSAGEVASIRAGTVRGIPARVRDDRPRRLRRLDGRDENGRLDEDVPPTLRPDPKLAEDQGKFWLAVRVKANEEGDLDPEDPESVVVTQETKIPENGHAIALVYLDEARENVEEVFQVAHHNLDFAILRDDESGLERYLFLPV